MSGIHQAEPTEALRGISPELLEIVELLPVDSTVNREFMDCSIELLEVGLAGIHEEFDEELRQHNAGHTLDTSREIAEILIRMRNVDPASVSARHIWLGVLAAMFHDRIEAFEIDGNGLEASRILQRGSNEHSSADFIVSLLVGVNERQGHEVYTGDDIVTIFDAIDRTIPEFISVNGFMTVHQHTVDANPVAFALSLADVNAAGTDEERFKRDGDRLLLEQFPYIDMLVRTLGGAAVGTRDIILDWSSRQIEFAKGRREILFDEICSADISPRLRGFLMGYFRRFEVSVLTAKDQVSKRVEMDVHGLLLSLRDAVYKPPSDQ